MVLKRVRQHWKLMGVSVLLLLPIVVAITSPLFAPIPTRAQGWAAPPLPERNQPLPDFQHLLEPLPLIVRDLPDAASKELVAIYDSASFSDGQLAQLMQEEAEAAIEVPSSLDRIWSSWLHDWQGDPVPSSVMESLQKDPKNADRLSNLAVAIYLTWFTTLGPDSYLTGHQLETQALFLLDSTVEYFPDSRAPILNYMTLQAASWYGGPEDNRGRDFDTWLAANPDDATALQLAVKLYVNSTIWDYEQKLETLQRYAADMSESSEPARAALGHALLGDLELGDLQLGQFDYVSRQDIAPFAVMQSARLALVHYDQALLLSDDPSIYTARALALEVLGDIPAAIVTQQRAVALSPDSVTLSLLLANLILQQRGTVEQVRDSVETARSIERDAISLTMAQAMPALHDVKFVRDTRETAGFTSNRPERFYVHYSPPMAGGGGIVEFTQIPLYSQAPTSISGHSPVDNAFRNIVMKSEVLGDPDGITEDMTRWQSIDTRFPSTAPSSSLSVAQIVADQEIPSSVDLESWDVLNAATWLRFSGANQQAIDLCKAAIIRSDAAARNTGYQVCIAENAYVMGDYETSQEAYEALDDDLMVGYVAERSDDPGEAMHRYRRVMESDGGVDRYIAMVRLAGILRESGSSEESVALYDDFLEWATTSGCVNESCLSTDDIVPLAYSNRGIARLEALTNSDGTIDCDDDAWEVCTSAFLDFESALGTDPANPYFLMNKAWVARLLNDKDLSKQVMEQAVETGMAPFPVLNDLGIFAAEAGDPDTARMYFRSAVAINPRYDLALWNLGVLHMRDGVGGLVRGQAYLARAIIQNPDLLANSLNLRSDENIYRIEVTEESGAGTGWVMGPAATVATALFGLLAIVPVFFSTLKSQVASKYLDEMNSWIEVWNQRLQHREAQELPNFLKLPWLPHLFSVTVLVLATALLTLRDQTPAAFALMIIALLAVMLAVIVHELGHHLAAWHWKANIQNDQWGTGSLISMGFLACGAGAGPYPSHRIQAEQEQDTVKVYLAGPIANAVVALIVYFAFCFIEPLPAFRIVAQAQVAAMAFALMPYAPLDGAAIARTNRGLLGVLGAFAAIFGIVVGLGLGAG